MKPASDIVPASNCGRCPRLAAYRRRLAKTWPDHFGAPVPAWGRADASLLIVGLAPGLHGAHRTGIPFFGDASGTLLISALTAAGYATPQSPSGKAVRITNAVKCLPPGNLPNTREVSRCEKFLAAELSHLSTHGGQVLTLGGVAHRAVLKALGITLSSAPFSHGVRHRISDLLSLVSSYHPSRLNTNTGRLTSEEFHNLIKRLSDFLPTASSCQQQ